MALPFTITAFCAKTVVENSVALRVLRALMVKIWRVFNISKGNKKECWWVMD
jgi:hypothetical protein